MTLATKSTPHTHQWAIGRHPGDEGDLVGILAREGLPVDTLLGLVENFGSQAFGLTFYTGRPSSGSVSLSDQPDDADDITIDDGINPAVTFEFDDDSSVTETSTLRQVVIGATLAVTAQNLVTAINNAPTLAIVATLEAGSISARGLVFVSLVGTVPDSSNVVLTGTDVATVQTLSGLSGGTGVEHTVVVNGAALAGSAAIGNVDLTANPADGNTVVLDDGVNPAVTYEFDNDASVVETATLQQVVIGIDAATTIASFISKVNTPAAGAVVGITAAAGAGDSADLTNDVASAQGNNPIVSVGANIATTGMAGGTAATLTVQPKGRVAFVLELALTDDANWISCYASGGDGVSGRLSLSYVWGTLVRRERWADYLDPDLRPAV